MTNFVRPFRNWVVKGVASDVNDFSVYKPVRVRVLSCNLKAHLENEINKDYDFLSTNSWPSKRTDLLWFFS